VTFGDEKRRICHNRILEYSTVNSTWEDVYLDLAKESDFSTNKTDVVNVCLSDKLEGTTTFFPDFHESLYVVKSFDKCLKYVTFKVTRDENVGLTSTTVAENQRHEGRETAFSVTMKGRGVYCFTSVRPSICARYFSSHFTQ
jgi:hypothetical protein